MYDPFHLGFKIEFARNRLFKCMPPMALNKLIDFVHWNVVYILLKLQIPR